MEEGVEQKYFSWRAFLQTLFCCRGWFTMNDEIVPKKLYLKALYELELVFKFKWHPDILKREETMFQCIP